MYLLWNKKYIESFLFLVEILSALSKSPAAAVRLHTVQLITMKSDFLPSGFKALLGNIL